MRSYSAPYGTQESLAEGVDYRDYMSPEKPVILVVDDIDYIVEELVTLLTLQGMPAIGAQGLDEALRLLEREPSIRVVACDVGLEGESGPDIVSLIQANIALRNRRLRYVFVTGDPVTAEPLERLLETSVLIKPVQPRALVAQFRELLGI